MNWSANDLLTLKKSVNNIDFNSTISDITNQLYDLNVVDYFYDILINGVNIHNLVDYMESMAPADDFFFDIDTFYSNLEEIKSLHESGGLYNDLYILLDKMVGKFKEIEIEDRRDLFLFLEKSMVLEFIKYVRSNFRMLRRNIVPINKYNIEIIQPRYTEIVTPLDLQFDNVTMNSIIANKININNGKTQIINTYGNTYYYNTFVFDLDKARNTLRREFNGC